MFFFSRLLVHVFFFFTVLFASSFILERNDFRRAMCPVCRDVVEGNLAVHLHNAHGPARRGAAVSEFRQRAPTLYAFALVVVRRERDGKYLLVQEFSKEGFWFVVHAFKRMRNLDMQMHFIDLHVAFIFLRLVRLPGGRVDSGEDFATAAIRETKEEGGVDVELTGILQVEMTPHREHVRMRVIFAGRPIPDHQDPKTMPDYESAGAVWVTPKEVMPPGFGRGGGSELRLRGPEPVHWIPYHAGGGQVYPLSLLRKEGCRPLVWGGNVD